MNVLPQDRQARIIGCLVEGNSIRSTERLTGVHRDTIMKLGVKVGSSVAYSAIEPVSAAWNR